MLLGSHGKLRSPIADVGRLAYLHVQLLDGETWRYQPPADHDVAWVAVNRGKLHVAGAVVARRMAAFEEGDAALEVRAEGPTELVIGSAAKHPHPLVCGYYSVHTSERALVIGEDGIRKVASALRAKRDVTASPGGVRVGSTCFCGTNAPMADALERVEPFVLDLRMSGVTKFGGGRSRKLRGASMAAGSRQGAGGCNNLEKLKGQLAGLYSIRINDRWRIVFAFENGQASSVRIADYH